MNSNDTVFSRQPPRITKTTSLMERSGYTVVSDRETDEEIKQFKIMNPDGSLVTYSKDSLVEKNGIVYRAIRNTSGYSPEHGSRGGWEEYSEVFSKSFIYSDVAPELPKQGDFWMNKTSGKFFIFLIDDDGSSHWVEV
jgi:hypothetical protein